MQVICTLVISKADLSRSVLESLVTWPHRQSDRLVMAAMLS